jgi:hypothetical protein
MKDKYGNSPFKTVVYRGNKIDFYADDGGQSFYFYFDGIEYGCGTYNMEYEKEMHYVVDYKMDFVKRLSMPLFQMKDGSYYFENIDIMRKEGEGYWFNCKAGSDSRVIRCATFEDAIKLGSEELQRFKKWFEDPSRSSHVMADLAKDN